jgi:Flp pilus assembly protein TadG
MRAAAIAKRLRDSAKGNVGLIVALVLPGLSVLTVGAIELGFVLTDKGKLQAAADAASLAAAHELALAVNDGVTERAEAMALAQVEQLQSRSSVTAAGTIVDDGAGIKVVMTAHRDSFFGNLLPPGGFTTRAEATAIGMSRTPLCILVDGSAGQDKAANLLDSSKVKAEGCLVHSNRDIVVEGSGRIEAGAVQSVGGTTGSVSPNAEVGAEPIADPFKGKDLSTTLGCSDLKDKILTKGIHNLPAGRHCKEIVVKADAKLRLSKGEHYFTNSNLILSERSSLEGKDVVLIFDQTSKMEFKDSTTIDLYGRTEGEFAGFLIITSRTNKNDFIMWSNNIRNLLGVVYIPEAKLIVQGTDQIAELSAWTVIVARQLQLKGSPTLVINRDYALSDVPVPLGVGNVNTEARLSE